MVLCFVIPWCNCGVNVEQMFSRGKGGDMAPTPDCPAWKTRCRDEYACGFHAIG